MTDLDFESNRLLVLLTDALKDGPGSPAWHEALAAMHSAGVTGLDDAAVLMRVREHLESGRSFRTIRAGGGFTRTLMENLNSPSAAPRRKDNWLLLSLCVAIVLVTVGVIATLLWRSGAPTEPDGGVLINIAASIDFDNGLPGDWQAIGILPLTTNRNALLPKVANTSAGAGGGLAWTRQLGADEPFSFSAVYRLPHSGDSVAELFVSDQPMFNATTGITPHELVWFCEGRMTSVIAPSGQVLVQQPLTADTRNAVPIRVTINGSRVVVEQSGKQLYAGSSQLEAGKSRAVGLRFLKADAQGGDDFGFARVRINTRPATP